MANVRDKLNNNFPWLLFKLGVGTYAVNSKEVTGIATSENFEITAVPEEGRCVLGITTFRGAPVKIIGLRQFLNMPSTDEEYDSFKSMIEMRKDDHRRWVAELDRCVEGSDHFTLAQDPHKCAFGKWYDTFESDVHVVNFQMKKIAEPHAKLHESAAVALSEGSGSQTMTYLKEQLMPEVLELLDGASDVLQHLYRNMIIMMEVEGESFGIAVDEVLSVEDLTFMEADQNMKGELQTNTICGIATLEKSEDMILVLDSEVLLHAHEI